MTLVAPAIPAAARANAAPTVGIHSDISGCITFAGSGSGSGFSATFRVSSMPECHDSDEDKDCNDDAGKSDCPNIQSINSERVQS